MFKLRKNVVKMYLYKPKVADNSMDDEQEYP